MVVLSFISMTLFPMFFRYGMTVLDTRQMPVSLTYTTRLYYSKDGQCDLICLKQTLGLKGKPFLI